MKNLKEIISKNGFVVINNWESKAVINQMLGSVLKSNGELTPLVFNYWTNGKLTDLIYKIMGSINLFCHTCNIRKKSNQTFTKTPLHQDSAYILPQSLEALDYIQLTIWMPLVDVNLLNGTLKVDNSFINKPMEHINQDSFQTISKGKSPSEFQAIIANAGSIVIMHHNLLHYSEANDTEKIRWSVDFRYQNYQIPYSDMKQGFMVKPQLELSYEEFLKRRVRLPNPSGHNYSLIKNAS